MSLSELALRGLWYHRRVNLAVVAAVAVATAVLTGALLVGDSMRGSLRALTLDRLGEIDFAIISDRFFRQALAAEIAGHAEFAERYSAAVPVGLMPSVTVELMGGGLGHRARGVTLIGCDSEFWQLDTAAVVTLAMPSHDEVWLNQALADEIGASVGDRVVLRLPQADDVPADSPLGRKDGAVRNIADLRVSAVLPDQGLGRFQLHPSQARSLNAFVPLLTLQRALDVTARVNAIFFQASTEGGIRQADSADLLARCVEPRLTDYGIRVDHVRQTYVDSQIGQEGDEQVAFEYFHVVNDRLVWSDAARHAALAAFADLAPQEMFTYLANTIVAEAPAATESADGSNPMPGIPYSTIAAVDSSARVGPLLDQQGASIQLAEDEIALNSWAADDLGATLGDPIWVRYFAPETTHGSAEERTERLRLAAIVSLTEPAKPFRRGRAAAYDQRPTLATDPHLTPEVEGVTDQETIADWDPPFPFDQRRIRPQDDRYWDEYRTTPKAFVSLATGKRLWQSRFGETTGFRLAANVDAGEVEQRLERSLSQVKSQLGFEVIPIKANALRAASGTTSFAGLFMGFSFFLIVAAMTLVAILFRLGVDLRLRDLGLLAALGWTRSRSRRLILLEGAMVGVLGAAIGVAGGAAYAALMLGGLRNWWVDAIVTPFVRYHATPGSLIGGGLASVLTCLIVMWFSLRGLRHAAPQGMLAGRLPTDELQRSPKRGNWACWMFVILSLAAGCLAVRLNAEAQAGAFFGSGACVLIAGLLWLRGRLAFRDRSLENPSLKLGQLAWTGLARHPGRTMMTVGLIASACFLIVAIAAFRLAPSEQGTGGFRLIVETDRPIFVDFEDPNAVRQEMGNQADALAGAGVVGLRAEAGSDASCRNLYQASRPRMLGIPRRVAEGALAEAKFGWAGSEIGSAENPWRALFRDHRPSDLPAKEETDARDVIPVVLDKNTAMYSLHAGGKIGSEFSVTDPSGREFTFRTVGLLSNSIFQGQLLIAEEQLTRLFPENAGQRYFLIDCDPDSCQTVNAALADHFGDQGWIAREAVSVLAELLAIQNTYLSTFQSLGALGLLLGTVGLACVQFRNLMERRRELGLLQAIGFTKQRISRLVFRESATTLLLGLVIGTAAALVTTLPHMVFGTASVPWASALMALVVVLVCGLATAAVAVHFALRTPILEALRGD